MDQYIKISDWGQQMGLSEQDVLVLCKKQKIPVNKIGTSKFALKSLLQEKFIAEMVRQEEILKVKSEKISLIQKSRQRVFNILKNQNINILESPNMSDTDIIKMLKDFK